MPRFPRTEVFGYQAPVVQAECSAIRCACEGCPAATVEAFAIAGARAMTNCPGWMEGHIANDIFTQAMGVAGRN